MIDRLLYRSRAVGTLPEIALEKIFRASVPNNARLNITGALGFAQGSYMQLLEGPPSSLDELMATLQADPRHTELRVMIRGPSEGRLLPTWSMARVDLAKFAPDMDRSIRAEDGLGLIALMATLAHQGLTT